MGKPAVATPDRIIGICSPLHKSTSDGHAMLATSSPHSALLKAQRAAAGNCTARRSFFANEISMGRNWCFTH
jgi:hypothetical protein